MGVERRAPATLYARKPSKPSKPSKSTQGARGVRWGVARHTGDPPHQNRPDQPNPRGSASVPGKIRRAREEILRRGLRTEVEAGGGIRRETVPPLREAGADWVVPGSLLFDEDPPALRRWLAALSQDRLGRHPGRGPRRRG